MGANFSFGGMDKDGLTKLAEELGEYIHSATLKLHAIGSLETEFFPDYNQEINKALSDEAADVIAASHFVMENFSLSEESISKRGIAFLDEHFSPETGHGNVLLKSILSASALIQTAMKKSAFMDEDNHPDGAGSLKERLENGIGETLGMIMFHQHTYHDDPQSALSPRADEKKAKFKDWHTRKQPLPSLTDKVEALRAKFWKDWAVQGMAADKQRLAKAAFDDLSNLNVLYIPNGSEA